MTQREQYLFDSTKWSHGHPYVEKPHPKIDSPDPKYELFPGWQVFIMITSKCNTKCNHCYISYQGSFEPKELINIINGFQKDGYNVYLNGAEPLINPAYLSAFKAADQKIVMTNGLVLYEYPKYIYDIQRAGVETIGVSYHFDIHSYFSKVPLSVARTALYVVKRANMHARVMTTITKPYIDKIPEYCAWCVEYGFKEIRFTNFIAQGKARNLDRDLILNQNDREHYYEVITRERAKYDINELCITSCGSFGNCGSPHMTCAAVRDFVVLTPEYKVYPCFFQAQPGSECGFYQDGHIFTLKNFQSPEHDCASLHLFND